MCCFPDKVQLCIKLVLWQMYLLGSKLCVSAVQARGIGLCSPPASICASASGDSAKQ